MIVAKDLMTPQPLSIHISEDIQAVVDFMTEHKLSTLPVVNTQKILVGVITEISILKVYIRVKAQGLLHDKIMDHKEIFEPISSVLEADDISKVVQVSLKAPHHRVFVVDTHQVLKGVISPKDILDIISEKPKPKVSLHKELTDLRAQVEKMVDVQFKLKNTEQQLSNYVNLLDASKFMLHTLNKEGMIIFANPRLHLVLGYPPGELIGKKIHDLYPDHLWEPIENSIKNYKIHLGDKETKYIGYKTKNGEVLKVEATTQFSLDDQGKLIAISTISRIIDSEKLLKLLNGVLN